MANEITITISALNTNLQDDFTPAAFLVDQTTLGADGGITTVGTGEEDLVFDADVGSEGFFMLTNLDTGSNYVIYGPKDTTLKDFGRIRPGHSAILQLEPGITLRWKAVGGTVKIQWKLWEL